MIYRFENWKRHENTEEKLISVNNLIYVTKLIYTIFALNTNTMIILNPTQQDILNRLTKKCENIERDLATPVNPNEPQDIQSQIEKLRPHLSDVSTMMADATSIYDYAKGECYKEIMKDSKLLTAKATIQKMWIDGELNEFNALYVRVESVTKALKNSIDGLVSMLAMEREKIKNLIHHD